MAKSLFGKKTRDLAALSRWISAAEELGLFYDIRKAIAHYTPSGTPEWTILFYASDPNEEDPDEGEEEAPPATAPPKVERRSK